MNTYYATFMQKQAFKNHYIKIEADSMEIARETMFAHFGDKFMTVYPEEKFEGQAEEYNLHELCSIKTIVWPHNGSHEYIFDVPF